jgi:perosamine synthetase
MDFYHTHISQKSVQLVNEVLKSTFISAGKMADSFEAALSQRLGLINPVTVNSGTSALHLGLIVAGVGPGDEVIIPAQTFIATGLAVKMCDATPVFADIQLDTGNISPESIKQKITSKTKAIIPVHWGGYPCDMDEINAIAKEHNLVVLEDAAHALGASYKNKPIGSISELTAFSFQAIKHLTTGDGGALCCLNESISQKARTARWFGIDRQNSQPSILGERVYDATTIGFKYHMNDLAAALGLGNLEDLSQILDRRAKIAGKYREQLKDVPGLTLLNYKDDRKSSNWLFTMLVERREDFIRALQEKGIPSSVVHLRIDKNSVFGGIRKDLPNQEKFNELQISIPVHQGLNDEDVDLIIKTIKAGW